MIQEIPFPTTKKNNSVCLGNWADIMYILMWWLQYKIPLIIPTDATTTTTTKNGDVYRILWTFWWSARCVA